MRRDTKRHLLPGPTPPRRAQLWRQHPLTAWDNSLILPFPAMRAVARDVIGELSRGRGGHAFIADSQFGKSTTIHYLEKIIPEVFPHMRVLSLEFERRPTPSLLSFYAHVIEAIDPYVPLRSQIDARALQAVNEFLTLALPHPPPTVVILLDEGQNVHMLQYEWLKYFVGRLQKRGVRVMVFVFGQPKLQDVVNHIRAEHGDHLLKRFFRGIYALHGTTHVFTLKRIFQIFDQQARFPAGPSGWPFSQFYFPEAFAAGWRLTNEAGMAWKVMVGDKSGVKIGTDVIRDMLQYYFLELSQYDNPSWKGTPELWQAAVDASDFLRT